MREQQNPSSSAEDVPVSAPVAAPSALPSDDAGSSDDPASATVTSAAAAAIDAAAKEDGERATANTGPVIATLTSARMPADHGITSLALLMQLGGSIGIVLGVLMALGSAVGSAGALAGPFFVIAVASCIRSAFHRAAGATLLYGTGTVPARSVNTDLVVSLAHTVLSLALMENYVDAETMFKFGALFLCWPVALFVFFSRPHIKTLIASGVPHAEDYGFEGASVLMTLFGIMGTLITGLLLQATLGQSELMFATTAGGIVVMVLMALVARSVIQALAGLKGISGADFEECNAAASRYYNFGVMSSVCVGVTFFVVIFMATQSMLWAMLFGAVLTVLLLAWPQIVRRLYSERNFHVFLAGSEAQTFQRAPDAGLIALGWTLVAISSLSLGNSLAEAIWNQPLTGDEIMALLHFGGVDAVEQAMRSPWWAVGVGMLQLWAGIELIRMSSRHKLAAMIYGCVSVAIVFYLVWPMMDSMESMFSGILGDSGPAQSIALMVTGVPLVLAIGTIVLVNRTAVPSAVVHTSRKSASDATGHAATSR